MQQKKEYINGLKGIACFMIMFGHYLGIYKYAEEFNSSFRYIDLIADSKINYIINESFWVYLFFVVSGYLVAQSKVESLKLFFQKSIKRFLRLGLPILSVCIIIYIMYITIGFHNAETESLFTCTWFQSFFSKKITYIDIIKSPISILLLGNSGLNSPYWVLKDMFFSSILIYFLSYIKTKTVNNRCIFYSAFFIAIIVGGVYSNIMGACLSGAFIVYFIEEKSCDNGFASISLLVTALLLYIMPKSSLATISFAVLIVLLPKIKFLKDLVSNKLFLFLGEISWGVYSFHWSIICTIGSLLMIRLSETYGLNCSFIFSFLISTICTVIISIVFRYTIEKAVFLIIGKIKFS